MSKESKAFEKFRYELERFEKVLHTVEDSLDDQKAATFFGFALKDFSTMCFWIGNTENAQKEKDKE